MPVDYLARHLNAGQLERLAGVKVGIAGAGGLGSNCALMLARSGIRSFIFFDGDMVEVSNLNRQCYFPRHVGLPKVGALAGIIAELDPRIKVEAKVEWLTHDTIAGILPLADLWVEALDGADMKQSIMRMALKSGKFIVGASGLAGWGGPPMERRTIKGQDGKMRAVLVGDMRTGVGDASPPMAPRVVQAAAMQADVVLEYILGENGGF